MPHNWYHDLTEDQRLSGDPKSPLVWLCDECAAKLAGRVRFAKKGTLRGVSCWGCNKPARPTERTEP
jgi:hypothetical protein